MPGKDSVYCPGSVFFCSDTQIEIVIIIISLQQLLLSEELHIKPTAVESSRPSPALAHAESLWLSHLSPGPLSSVLRSEQKPPVPSQSPVSPRDQPVSFSSLCPLPENCPLSPASRSLLQGTCRLLAGPDGGSMVPAVCCVPLSVRRTSSPETLTSPASLRELCCPSRSVLGLFRGQEHFAGSRGPGSGSLSRPRPLPPLSSFPP